MAFGRVGEAGAVVAVREGRLNLLDDCDVTVVQEMTENDGK